jgi:chromosome segregation ATPase
MFRFIGFMPMLLLAPDDGLSGNPSSNDANEDTGNTEDDTNSQVSADETQSIEELQNQLEELKKQSSSKDKAVTKLTKQIDEMKKAQMSDAERKAAEERERQEQLQQERDQFLTDCRIIAAERAGLSENEATLVAGSSQEEIRENGKLLKSLLEARFSEGYEKAKKEGMKSSVPRSGEDPAAGTNKRLSDLFTG